MHDETGSPWKAAPRQIYRRTLNLYLSRILLKTMYSIFKTEQKHKNIKLLHEIEDKKKERETQMPGFFSVGVALESLIKKTCLTTDSNLMKDLY